MHLIILSANTAQIHLIFSISYYSVRVPCGQGLKQRARIFFIRALSGCHAVLTSPKKQREYSSKPLKHSIVKRILVFKQ